MRRVLFVLVFTILSAYGCGSSQTVVEPTERDIFDSYEMLLEQYREQLVSAISDEQSKRDIRAMSPILYSVIKDACRHEPDGTVWKCQVSLWFKMPLKPIQERKVVLSMSNSGGQWKIIGEEGGDGK